MSKRVVQRRKLRKPQVGDMRDEIIISARDIAPPLFDTESHRQVFTDPQSCFAKTDTFAGVEIFQGTNLLGVKTHAFTIRDEGLAITTEHVVEFKGNFFAILRINNFEERDLFLLLECGEKGDKTLDSTQ